MLRPIDIVRCFHNAFRQDMHQIDKLTLNIALEGGELTPIFDRLQIIGEALDYHARGEEAAVFPTVDKIMPLISPVYTMDHRELDRKVEELEAIRKAPSPIIAARATAVLNSILRIHLDKEDAYLYPFLRENTTDDEQRTIGRVMASKMPPEKVPVQVQWLFNLLDLSDQVKVTRLWMLLMPPQVFAQVKPLIQKYSSANWVHLTRQISELDSR